MEPTENDLDLLKRLKNDDGSAFQQIYEHYSEGMFRYAMNIFRDREACEDIVQNIFVDLWSRRKEVSILKLKSFLFQAVKFQVFKQMKRVKFSAEDLNRLTILDESKNILNQIEFEEFQDLLKAKLEVLPAGCQKVFSMSRFDYKSNKEIAVELNISVQAVKNQIGKALKFLRQEFLTPIH